MEVPPIDHDCSLKEFVTELANRLAKLEHENAQLRKSLYGRKSESSKLPRVQVAEAGDAGAGPGHAAGVVSPVSQDTRARGNWVG